MRALPAVLAIAILGAAIPGAAILGAVPPAAAEPIGLALSNCTDLSQQVVAYEAADITCTSPRVVDFVPRCETVDLSCEGGCKVTVVGIKQADCGSPRALFGEMIVTSFGISHKSTMLGQTDEYWAALCACEQDEMNY